MPKILTRVNGVGENETGQVWGSTTGTPPLRLSLADGYAPLGADILVNGAFTTDLSSWTNGGNWAWNTATAKHTAGSVATLSQAVTAVNGGYYIVTVTITGRTAGSIVLALGVNASAAITASTNTTLIAPAASTTLSITPTTDFDGAVDLISLQLVGLSTPTALLEAPSGSIQAEVRAASGHLGIGIDVLSQATASTSSTAYGFRVLRRNTTGTSNVGMGFNALTLNTTGANNTALGTSAMVNNTIGGSNTAVGTSALLNNTNGSSNVAVGGGAMVANTTGFGCTAVGVSALATQVSAGYNTAVGNAALNACTGGTNVAVGELCLGTMSTGSSNVAVGDRAGWSPAGVGANATTTGTRQTLIGHMTGVSSTTQRNDVVCLGYFAVTDGNNAIAIGSGTSAGAAGAIAIGKDSAGTSASTTVADEIKLGTATHTINVPGSIGALLTFGEGINIAVGATTGTKIGTATTQKLGFFGATPIVQPAATTDLRQALINLGLYTTGGATPLDLNGGSLSAVSVSAGSIPSTTGAVRLANNTSIAWRNATNTADISSVSVNNSNELTLNVPTGSAGNLNVNTTTAFRWTSTLLTVTDAVNIAVGTTTGTMIGTSNAQKLGFYGATPIVPPSSTTDLRQALINLGLYTTGGATPLNLNGGALTTTGALNAGATIVGTLAATSVAVGATPALSGALRLTNNTSISWRNATNAADVAAVTFNNSNDLTINVPTGSNGYLQVNSGNVLRWTATQLIMGEGVNFAIGDVTGSKIGVTTLQKIGFWNATPVIQPTTAVTAATFVANTGTAVNDASTFDGYTLGKVVKALRTLGILA